jgi:hypothetical protein
MADLGAEDKIMLKICLNGTGLKGVGFDSYGSE